MSAADPASGGTAEGVTPGSGVAAATKEGTTNVPRVPRNASRSLQPTIVPPRR
jgi:hypothetical protein